MFARTERLTLRPPWPEDAPALAATIGHNGVARMLAHVPHPYTLADAQAWLAQLHGPAEPRFLICSHEADEFALVGGIAILTEADQPHLGYWITPTAQGRGYATEAARAVMAIARDTLRLPRLNATCFTDNPASARVLAKLGFIETGPTALPSLARGNLAPAINMTLDLSGKVHWRLPIAA